MVYFYITILLVSVPVTYSITSNAIFKIAYLSVFSGASRDQMTSDLLFAKKTLPSSA